MKFCRQDLDLLETHLAERKRRLFRDYAPRHPMEQLPDKYHVTDSNPDPPLVHFALPIHIDMVHKYADQYNLTEYSPVFPHTISPVTHVLATQHLSYFTQYEVELGWPYRPTADCNVILVLYDNYTMEDKLLVDEDQDDVIEMVQEALGLDRSIRPKWYFDVNDLWQPGDSD